MAGHPMQNKEAGRPLPRLGRRKSSVVDHNSDNIHHRSLESQTGPCLRRISGVACPGKAINAAVFMIDDAI